MKVSIMQPAYLPWLGYFDRICQSDLHIILDNVHLDSSSKTKFSNRNKIRTKESWSWLTIPLKVKGKHGQLYLDKVEIASDFSWRKKHWTSIQNCYAKAPFFSDHRDFFDSLYARDWEFLSEIVEESTKYIKHALQIKCKTVRSSELSVSGEKDELILNLCKFVVVPLNIFIRSVRS